MEPSSNIHHSSVKWISRKHTAVNFWTLLSLYCLSCTSPIHPLPLSSLLLEISWCSQCRKGSISPPAWRGSGDVPEKLSGSILRTCVNQLTKKLMLFSFIASRRSFSQLPWSPWSVCLLDSSCTARSLLCKPLPCSFAVSSDVKWNKVYCCHRCERSLSSHASLKIKLI